MMTMAEKRSAKRPRGRPGVGVGETDVINIIVPSADMDRVRDVLSHVGYGATVAAWVREAIREKLERDEKSSTHE
jgi:hypothetical protein